MATGYLHLSLRFLLAVAGLSLRLTRHQQSVDVHLHEQ